MGKGLNMINGTSENLLPVFTWQYTQGKTYAPDPEVPTKIYSVPDGLVVTELEETREIVDEEMIQTFSEWIETKRTSFKVDVGVKINFNGSKALSGDASFDRESYSIKQQLKNSTMASGFSRKWFAYFQLEAYPPMFLKINPMFEQIVDALPPTIKTAADQAQYNQLVQYFGSHFMMNSKFGGRVHVDTFLSKSFMSKYSSQWVSEQISLTLHYSIFDISGGGFQNKSSIHISKAFKEASKTDIYYAGGDPVLQTNTTLITWVQSIPEHAHYMNATISDLSQLVKDPTKASTLQTVIKKFMIDGELPVVADAVDYGKMYASLESRRDIVV
jgi:hypothetical protein